MNRGLSLFCASLVAATLLAGCGGGGGNPRGSRGGSLTLSFVGDAGVASGPAGTSHKIVVYRTDGAVVDTKTIDLSSGTMQTTLTGLPSGTLHLHLSLSSTPGGAEIGAIDRTIEGGAALAPMQIVMRQPVAEASVSPVAASVAVGATTPLYAAARATDGSYVYTAPGDWAWSSETPARATVDAAGVVTGVADGNATIQATHTPSAHSDTATVSVSTSGIRRGKWTIMVYMNAANDLFPFATQNMNQMERIADNPDVRFVVQWKQVQNVGGNSNPLFSGTRRYVAKYDTKTAINSTVAQDLGRDVDMGSADALTEFVQWTKANYPADHYAIVLWNHGAGWNTPRALRLASRGISYDEETGNHLDPWDVRSALLGQHVDILAFDACLMQGAEDLLELSSNADYIIGSEENTPGPGYPYHQVFKPFVDAPDNAVPALASSLVTEFQNYYATGDYRMWALHQSVLSTSKASAFRTALDNFGLALVANGAEMSTNGNGQPAVLASAVRSICTRIAPGDGYSYYDVTQLAQAFASKSTNANVQNAANALKAAVDDMVVASQSSANGGHMKGVSIEFSRSGTFANYAGSYGQLRLSALTHWDEFLANSQVNP